MTVNTPVSLVDVFNQYADLKNRLEDAQQITSDPEKAAKLSAINSACIVLDEQLNSQMAGMVMAYDREKQTPAPVSWWTSSKTGVYAGGGCLVVTTASLVASLTTHFPHHHHLSAAWLLPAVAGAWGLCKIVSSMSKDAAAETQKRRTLFKLHHEIGSLERSLSMFGEVKKELSETWATLPEDYRPANLTSTSRSAVDEKLTA